MRPLLAFDEIPPDAVLLDARNAAAYAGGHLPGARHADPDRFLSAPRDPRVGGRHPLPPLSVWLQQLGAWGIGPETPVVAYDDQNGANAAARAWWMLRAVGHERVAVLDGPLPPSLTTEAPDVTPLPPYPAPADWQLPTVTRADVEHLRLDPGWRVLDVRSAPRYRGETEPIDPVAGHIPGAVNLPYSENLTPEGRFKSAGELRALYSQLLGDLPPGRLIVHCGSGITACHTLLALDAAALPGAALYVGSWSEWCRNEELPRG